MIIWGSKAQERQIRSGSFYCPNCRTNAAYSLVRVSRYFTLYFIPLFPTQTLGEFVRCGNCHGELRPEVLSLTPEQIDMALEPWTCSECGTRNDPRQKECLECTAARPSQPPALSQVPRAAATAAPVVGGSDPESYDY